MSPSNTPALYDPPVTYSKRPASTDYFIQRKGAIGSNDREARGEQAVDRISQQARSASDFRASAQRAVHALNGSGKPGAWGKRTIHNSVPQNSLKNTDVVRCNGNHPAIDQGERDIPEALARSLNRGKGVAPKAINQYDYDVAKAMTMSLLSHNEPSSPSCAAGPYHALEPLMDSMEASMKWLDTRVQEDNVVAASQVAGFVETWQSIVSTVIYAAKIAEDERVENIRAQLKLDQKIEERHQRKVDQLNRMWESKLLEMQREWQNKMDKQEQIYEARIVEQNSAIFS